MDKRLVKRLVEATQCGLVVWSKASRVPLDPGEYQLTFKHSAEYGGQTIELLFAGYTRFSRHKEWFALEVDGNRVDAPPELLANLYHAIQNSREQSKKNLLERLEGA